MASADSTALSVRSREVDGSRAARRLRREGNVPGVVYGGGEDPLAFQIDARELRNALAHAGAVLDLKVDGGSASPVVLKDLVRHPVNGETVHVDLLRVRLDQAIQSTVVLELVGAEDSPGIKEGGVLEQITRELTIEALPGDIPDSLEHDVSALEMGATLTLDAIAAPSGVTLLDDPETVVASITAPRLVLEDETDIEEETGLVGEGEEGEGEGETPEGESGESDAAEGGDGESASE